ncbi:unnamed protein product [Merluccius merluccius]
MFPKQIISSWATLWTAWRPSFLLALKVPRQDPPDPREPRVAADDPDVRLYECLHKYSSVTVWRYWTEICDYPSLSTINDSKTPDQIPTLDRNQEVSDDGPMCELLWSVFHWSQPVIAGPDPDPNPPDHSQLYPDHSHLYPDHSHSYPHRLWTNPD